MDRRGHYGMALLLSAPVVAVLGWIMSSVSMGIPFGVLAVSTSMFPDVDMHLPGIRHRGPTHTLLFGVLASAFVGVIALGVFSMFFDLTVVEFGSVYAYAFCASLVGIASHLFADALTVGSGRFGVHPFWPHSDREFRFGVARSNSFTWNNGLLGLGIAVYLSMFALFD